MSRTISEIKTYYYWRRKLKREVFENVSDELAQDPLIPVASKSPVFSKLELNTAKPLSSESVVTIFLNDISIEIRSSATEMVIRITKHLSGEHTMQVIFHRQKTSILPADIPICEVNRWPCCTGTTKFQIRSL